MVGEYGDDLRQGGWPLSQQLSHFSRTAEGTYHLKQSQKSSVRVVKTIRKSVHSHAVEERKHGITVLSKEQLRRFSNPEPSPQMAEPSTGINGDISETSHHPLVLRIISALKCLLKLNSWGGSMLLSSKTQSQICLKNDWICSKSAEKTNGAVTCKAVDTRLSLISRTSANSCLLWCRK